MTPSMHADVDDGEASTPPAVPAAPGAPTVASGTPVDVAIPAPVRGGARMISPEGTWYERIEAFVSRLSVRDNFWRSVCSLIWLPLAFFSGLKMKEIDKET